MPALITKKISALLLLLLVTGCSSIRQYPDTTNTNFTAEIDQLELASSFAFTNEVDVHVHSNPAKSKKLADCVPDGDWYLGSVTGIGEEESESIRLPVGQRVYVIAKHVMSWHSYEEVIEMAFDLIPEKGVQYSLKYNHLEHAKSVKLIARKGGKEWKIPMKQWLTCG